MPKSMSSARLPILLILPFGKQHECMRKQSGFACRQKGDTCLSALSLADVQQDFLSNRCRCNENGIPRIVYDFHAMASCESCKGGSNLTEGRENGELSQIDKSGRIEKNVSA
jgi:hypothetical protein